MEVQAFAAGIVHAQGTGGVFEGQAGGDFVEAVPAGQVMLQDDGVYFAQEGFVHRHGAGFLPPGPCREEEAFPFPAYREGPVSAALAVAAFFPVEQEEVRVVLQPDEVSGCIRITFISFFIIVFII